MALDIDFLPLELEELPALAKRKKKAGFRFVQMLCVTTQDGIDLQYSFMKEASLENYTIRGVRPGTKVPSVTETYISAFVFENEAHDLFGVEIEGNLLDFGGNFYKLSEREPMTIISPAQKAAREKAVQEKAAGEEAAGEEAVGEEAVLEKAVASGEQQKAAEANDAKEEASPQEAPGLEKADRTAEANDAKEEVRLQEAPSLGLEEQAAEANDAKEGA
ncbi:MAG: NADH-quinone oxidoreductase subunit C [Coriobacteriaceae bacterium]|jgi:hypothetical protein|nr:NADH-quinone oxidoreductase subunit C [Coriobacteriaceae bacterium]